MNVNNDIKPTWVPMRAKFSWLTFRNVFHTKTLSSLLLCVATNFNTYNAAGMSRQQDQNVTNLVKKCKHSGI